MASVPTSFFSGSEKNRNAGRIASVASVLTFFLFVAGDSSDGWVDDVSNNCTNGFCSDLLSFGGRK